MGASKIRTLGDLERGLEAGDPEAAAIWADWRSEFEPVVQKVTAARAEMEALTRDLSAPPVIVRPPLWRRAAPIVAAVLGTVASVVSILAAFGVL
jgi:hypothetical protein